MDILIYMSTKLSKWGNSLAFRISSSVVSKLNLSLGDVMMLNIKGNSIVLSPKVSLKHATKLIPMKELVKGFKGKKQKDYWGLPMGKEVW